MPHALHAFAHSPSVCVYACLCTCLFQYRHISVHVCTHVCTHVCGFMYMSACPCTCSVFFLCHRSLRQPAVPTLPLPLARLSTCRSQFRYLFWGFKYRCTELKCHERNEISISCLCRVDGNAWPPHVSAEALFAIGPMSAGPMSHAIPIHMSLHIRVHM